MAQTPLSPVVSIISEMITPALLILASGSLLATVLARLGRVVDYVRKFSDQVEGNHPISPVQQETLRRMEQRADYAENSITSYYIAVCCFVLTCLLIGVNRITQDKAGLLPLATAIIGVSSLLVGSFFMVAECRLAVKQLKSEVKEIWSKIDKTS